MIVLADQYPPGAPAFNLGPRLEHEILHRIAQRLDPAIILHYERNLIDSVCVTRPYVCTHTRAHARARAICVRARAHTGVRTRMRTRMRARTRTGTQQA